MSIINTIETYRKRRQTLMPLIIGGTAVLLVVIGIIVLIAGFSGGGGFHLFSTRTPTPTNTLPPTNTSPPTNTPTITPTPTETPPSAPYPYVVQDGDTLYGIVEKKGLGPNGLILIYQLNSTVDPTIKNTIIDSNNPIIRAGDTIILPPPNMEILTSTPWPTDAAPGTYIRYFVMPDDSLGSIAAKLNSTVDAIVRVPDNKTILSNGAASVIYPGQVLVVPVNLVKPTSTTGQTATSSLTATPSLTASPTRTTTPTPTNTPTSQ